MSKPTFSVIPRCDFDNNCFINRELSLLSFNLRVLEQALDTNHPLLERLKYLLIFCSNIDEFFEVRVAKLKASLHFGVESFIDNGLSARNTLKSISDLCHIYIENQYKILNENLLPALENENIHFLRRESWTDKHIEWINHYFLEEVAPVISPIALDPAHPFPKLVNKSLNFIASLKGKDAFGRESRLAIVPAPRALPRLIKLPPEFGDGDRFVFLSAIIHANIDHFFHGMKATGCYQFRVTRNSDLYVNEESSTDIAAEVEGKLFNRKYGHAVRLEVVQNCPENIKQFLMDEFHLTEQDLYEANGPVNLQRLFALYGMIDRPDLQYPLFSPELPTTLTSENNLFENIHDKDYLLYHPFSSFTPVLEFLRQAARDPAVISIKQTLYRVGHDSEIVKLLAEAARNGKEVTVVVELKARFDEQENLTLASLLQKAGAVVCYGVVGYKTHAKMMLVLRKESGKYKRYVHLGTGNYHTQNARIYTDYSLFTSNLDICEDVHNIFQQLTGMGKTLPMKMLANAPFSLRKKLLDLIETETQAALDGKEAEIIIKANGLTDRGIITALYQASQTGVKIRLIIRGICVLKPGMPGISENIQVKSIIGHFLEHSRVFYFANSEPQLYLSSADLMERNLTKRIEICFPILSEKIKHRVLNDLNIYLEDEAQSWCLDVEGNYQLISKQSEKKLAQEYLLDKHCAIEVQQSS